jgi:acetyl-CoA C-acetyltransferase
MRKKVYAAAGYNTTYMGSGRPEFNPKKLRPFEEYLKETAEGTCSQLSEPVFDEGVIASFMSGRFLKQANLPGFLPFMVPSLYGKPCTAVEGACGSGGRAIAMGVNAILSDTADSVFVAGFEMQNTMKAVYGADVLAGASYYNKERKQGHAHFFPGIFARRAGAYYDKYGYEKTREAMAKWYEQSILNARHNPKAQEYHNRTEDLLALGMMPPNPSRFVPHLNLSDCSKVSDGASSIGLFSEEGLAKSGIPKEKAVEIIGVAGAEGNITRDPDDWTVLSTTVIAARKAFDKAGLSKEAIGLLELHDCFSITGLLALEAIGFAEPGKAAQFVLEGKTAPDGKIPINLSGGLGGFGHPTGATGVRQLVDLTQQLTGCAPNQIETKASHGMMVSMGGNDKTVTCIIARAIQR